MDLSEDICNSLMKWLQTLELERPVQKLEELSDGVIMAQALVQIAPDYFVRLNSSVHSDAGSNWRLKVNNLKKIIKCLEEYYHDVLNLHLLDMAKPDVIKIGELNDQIEIGKLLQLILGCAVNCDLKQEYITRIMSLEESVQQNIMQAIQQLEAVSHGRGRSSLSLLGLESDAKYQRLVADLEAATETKELLSQKCHNLETQVTCLAEEKCSLSTENNRLVQKLKGLESIFSREEPDGLSRSAEMRRQIESLKEDLYKTETQRDDYRLKVLELEKDMQMLQEKIVELQSSADKAAQLKDEIDALTETADKAKALEMSVASYKKKLEEYADLKRKYKIVKDENNDYYQQNLKYQEEIKRNNVYKSQSELYKKQVSDLHQKIDEEIAKSDKVSFENKKLESKLLMVQRERESLIEERNALKEMNEELRCQQRQNQEGEPAVACELAPTELQTRIKYLEKENHTLRYSAEEAVAKQLLLEDVQHRLEKAIEVNRNYHQRILELEAQIEELSKTSTDQQQVDELAAYKTKCTISQDALTNKENEIHTNTEHYKKSVEKAKEIIKQLDFDGTKSTRQQTDETAHIKRNALMRETEERLLTTCFYRMGNMHQREAVHERFALLNGQSFMSRQRQPTPAKTMQPYRSK